MWESVLVLKAKTLLDVEACQLLAWTVKMPQDLMYSVDVAAGEEVKAAFARRHYEAIPNRQWPVSGEGLVVDIG